MDRKWYKVKIYFPKTTAHESFTYTDEIKGTSPKNALENAYANWTEAEKIVLA